MARIEVICRYATVQLTFAHRMLIHAGAHYSPVSSTRLEGNVSKAVEGCYQKDGLVELILVLETTTTPMPLLDIRGGRRRSL